VCLLDSSVERYQRCTGATKQLQRAGNAKETENVERDVLAREGQDVGVYPARFQLGQNIHLRFKHRNRKFDGSAQRERADCANGFDDTVSQVGGKEATARPWGGDVNMDYSFGRKELRLLTPVGQQDLSKLEQDVDA
jgi:hypothetical protein